MCQALFKRHKRQELLKIRSKYVIKKLKVGGGLKGLEGTDKKLCKDFMTNPHGVRIHSLIYEVFEY